MVPREEVKKKETSMQEKKDNLAVLVCLKAILKTVQGEGREKRDKKGGITRHHLVTPERVAQVKFSRGGK